MDSFYSKLLLFGEHSVVNGGRALAIPFDHFEGSWDYRKGELDRGLIGFADYIDHHDTLFSLVKVDAFFSDLDRGLFFKSSIPLGYGLGSSGALVAATYRRYATTRDAIVSLSDIQKTFADLESHFHGKSSGFDPLVSYFNQALLVEQGSMRKLDTVDFNFESELSLCLIDTAVNRSTGPLVERYQEFISIASNKQGIEKDYLPLVDQAIQAVIEKKEQSLLSAIEGISGYQYAYLDFLIDKGSKEMWKDGLASDYFKVKICGAGGGGFLLGITTDLDRFKNAYPSKEIIKL